MSNKGFEANEAQNCPLLREPAAELWKLIALPAGDSMP